VAGSGQGVAHIRTRDLGGKQVTVPPRVVHQKDSHGGRMQQGLVQHHDGKIAIGQRARPDLAKRLFTLFALEFACLPHLECLFRASQRALDAVRVLVDGQYLRGSDES
jgi:hypothetical protein